MRDNRLTDDGTHVIITSESGGFHSSHWEDYLLQKENRRRCLVLDNIAHIVLVEVFVRQTFDSLRICKWL